MADNSLVHQLGLLKTADEGLVRLVNGLLSKSDIAQIKAAIPNIRSANQRAYGVSYVLSQIYYAKRGQKRIRFENITMLQNEHNFIAGAYTDILNMQDINKIKSKLKDVNYKYNEMIRKLVVFIREESAPHFLFGGKSKLFPGFPV